MIYIKIGLIPLVDYLDYMRFKYFNKEMAIKYTKENYNIDISNEVEYAWFYTKVDVYNEFEEKRKIPDDGTREYFNRYGRNYFNSFVKFIDLNPKFCMVSGGILPSGVVHHIYPLVFSNDNSLINLIAVHDIFHELLHLNPLENIKKYCFQSVDYLHYLCHGGQKMLIKKYNILQYRNDPSFCGEFAYFCIKQEMELFYQYIKELNAKEVIAS